MSEEGRGFPPVPLVLDTSVITAIARSDAQITSLILGYDDAGQPMVIPVLAMTAAAIDMHTDSTALVLRGLQKQGKIMVAHLSSRGPAAHCLRLPRGHSAARSAPVFGSPPPPWRGTVARRGRS